MRLTFFILDCQLYLRLTHLNQIISFENNGLFLKSDDSINTAADDSKS